MLQLLEQGQNVPPRLNVSLYVVFFECLFFFENVLQASFQLTCPNMDMDTVVLRKGMYRVKMSLDTNLIS